MSSKDTAETRCAKTPHAPSDESLEARIAALENQVQDLYGIIDQQAETIDAQQAQLDAQDNTIDTQQDQLNAQDETIDAQQEQIQELKDEQSIELRGCENPERAVLEDIWIADQPVGRVLENTTKRAKDLSDRVETLEESDPEQVKEDLHREQGTRAKSDAQIRTRLSQCEDELGIDKPDAIAREQGGEDVRHLSKLERFIRHGPEAVTERVYDVHERAREIALHFGEWGTKVNDATGKRIQLRSKKDKLKTHLEAAFDRRFQWNEVYRAIDKLAEIAYGTQLECKQGKPDEGKYVLELKISDGRGPSFARGFDE